MKKYRLNILILILVSILIMYLIMKDNFTDIINSLLNANLKYLLIACLFMFINILFQSISIHSYLKKIDKDYKFTNSFFLMSSSLFFNAITPFSTGGQPFQLYLLKKQGMKVTESGNALLQNFIAYQIALILVETVSIFVNSYFNIIPQTNLLRKIVMIGYAVNIIVLLVLVYFEKAKQINTKILNKIFKLKFMKNKQELKEKMTIKIDEFYNNSKFNKNKRMLFKSVIYNSISIISLCIIPLFVFFSVGQFDTIGFLDSIICTSYTLFVGAFFPIPGGTGGIEYAFLNFFKQFTNKSLLSASMILWRFITYYFPMIFGALSILFVKKKVNR